MSVVKVLLAAVWHVWWSHLFSIQRIPVEAFEPWMAFHFGDTINAESLVRLAHQALVHEVGGFLGVTCR